MSYISEQSEKAKYSYENKNRKMIKFGTRDFLGLYCELIIYPE